jgi:invasion protein IalB
MNSKARLSGLSLIAVAAALSASNAHAAAARNATPAPPPAPPPALPNGATSLNETFQNWAVACAVQGDGKRCAVSQVQRTQQNNQHVLTIQLAPPQGGNTTGTLVLPFGIALDNGATLQIDDRAAMPTLRFLTCQPDGCYVALNFDAATITTLRSSTTLKVTTVAANDGGTEVPFTIPLAGLAQALDRMTVLMR